MSQHGAPRLTVAGKPAYLKETFRVLTERYGDVPLSFVLAGSPTGSYTFRQEIEPPAAEVAEEVPAGTLPS